MDSALTGYCWAAQETLGESIQGVIVEGVQMSEVPRSSRKCPTHGMPYAECGSEFHLVWGMERFKRSASDMRGWKLDVIGLATQHHSNMTADWAAQGGVPQDGKFHGACYKYEGFAACDFAEWCEAGRPTDFTPALLGLEQVKEH